MIDQVAGLAARYLQLARAWDEQQGDARRANKLFDEHHAVAKQLRASEPGRQAIAALLGHEHSGVRLLAATDTLAWNPDAAVAVLKSIDTEPGLHAVTAKYTLKSYRDGTLDLDW